MFGSPIELVYIAIMVGVGLRIGWMVVDVAVHAIKNYVEK